ncbi:MAG: homoserine dehydrogenase, partial [Synergistaceae bacterium]|nr:homoserine dehydrogenase [Synergistaceae bacterium]
MINIAILGLGTVGGGVAEVVEKNQNEIKKSLGDNLHVKYILDIRDIPGVVKDINVIVNDPDVKVICETMGGKEPAYTYTHLALEHGISVCTSNKELVDAHGVELSEIARAHNCSYLFEASVGGGIPILRSLRESCGHEKISYIAGILNGTCNYILTNMKAGKDFDTALKEAQEKGFAERNPAADVEGHDTARKIAILASLVSGKKFSYEQVNCEGITKITQDDFVEAERNKMSIKLLGVYDAENNSVNVAPYLIPENHILYGVNDVFNGIFVKGNQIDNLMFYGRGAGKLPTASAVVSDVIE